MFWILLNKTYNLDKNKIFDQEILFPIKVMDLYFLSLLNIKRVTEYIFGYLQLFYSHFVFWYNQFWNCYYDNSVVSVFCFNFLYFNTVFESYSF